MTEFCGRYYVQSADTYGTSVAFPSWLYPLDGNRFVPGFDDDHLGGDNWVDDAAMDMMENEDWSGMFVTLGGIDKAGHMWGAQSDRQSVPGSPDFQTHVKFNAENADAQLGRMLVVQDHIRHARDLLVSGNVHHRQTGLESYRRIHRYDPLHLSLYQDRRQPFKQIVPVQMAGGQIEKPLAGQRRLDAVQHHRRIPITQFRHEDAQRMRALRPQRSCQVVRPVVEFLRR